MQQELITDAMNCRPSLASQVWKYARLIVLPWIFNAVSFVLIAGAFTVANGYLDDGPFLYFWYVALAGIAVPPVSWLNPLVVIAMVALSWRKRAKVVRAGQ